MARARVDGLTVRGADGVALVEDVSFEIGCPGRLAIMGPNGAGKSVLLRALAGLVEHEGNTSLPEPRGGVIQLAGDLFVTSTVRDEVAFAAACGPAAGPDTVDALLAATGLGALGDRDPASLSGGEQQRLHLAAALAGRPATLLLDEPAEHLDAASTRHVFHGIDRLPWRPPLVVYATHDADHALEADRLLLLSGGAVVGFGAPGDLFRDLPPENGWEVPDALRTARRLAVRRRLDTPLPVDYDALDAMIPPVGRT